MESCPKVDIPNFKELLIEQNLYLTTEEGEQGRVPVLILSMKERVNTRSPAIVFLHSTNKCKEWVRPLLEVGDFCGLHVDILQLPLILVTMENVPKTAPPMRMLLFHHGKEAIRCHSYLTRFGTL